MAAPVLEARLDSKGLRPLLALVSGVLLTLSFPKFGHPAVAFVALLPLLLAVYRLPAWRACRLGFLAGWVAGVGLLYWSALVVLQFGELPLIVGWLALGALAAAVALFPALFALLVALWTRRFGVTGLELAPFAWVATEMLRAYTFFRFPWCLLGYSQAEFPALIQIASWTAVYGVSLLVAYVSATLAALCFEHQRGERGMLVARLVILYAWVLGYGYHRLNSPPAEQGRLRVALVQANIAQEDKWDAEKLLGNIERHMQQTRSAAQHGARLVVWPESAVGFHYDDTPPVAEALNTLARQLDVYLLFGNDDREGTGPAEQAFVGAKLLTPEGRLALRYHKIRLVPFGEYVPLQGLLAWGGRYGAKLVQQVSDFTPGDAALVARVDAQPLSVLICYEAIFADLGRRFAANGAGLLVNITNDAWYGRTSAPYQHLAMASFRAVENGTYLVRAANTGISAVVDARGRIVERTPLFERATLVRDVPVVAADTFYARHGDVFGWACLVIALLATGTAVWPRRVRAVTRV